jgi:hypothetical protein
MLNTAEANYLRYVEAFMTEKESNVDDNYQD